MNADTPDRTAASAPIDHPQEAVPAPDAPCCDEKKQSDANTAGVGASESPELTNEQYAAAEKRASQIVDIHPYRGLLWPVLALYAVALLVPYSGSIRGWQVIFRSGATEVGIAETVFALFSALAALVGVGLLLATKRTVVANITYLLAGIALLTSVLSLWMRIQSAQNSGTSGPGVGHFIEIIAIIILVYTLSRIVFSRTSAQEVAAQQRAAHYQLDAVGQAQQAYGQANFDPAKTNPLLVDDRRQRAAQRHAPQPQSPQE